MITFDYNKHDIAFTAIKFNKVRGLNIPERFHTKLTFNNTPVDCYITTKIENSDLLTRVSDKKDQELGIGRYLKFDDELFNMSVNNYSGIKGIGSLLHLSQIITMLENNIPKIKLYALGNAIHFHSKFKFKSDFDSSEKIKDFIIKEIFLNHQKISELDKVREHARKWFAAKNLNKKTKIDCGNGIINEYIRVINEKGLYKADKYNPIQGMEMVLDKKSIKKYKDYFNKMFDNFGIDYHITKGV